MRDFLRSRGVDTSQWQDDQTAANAFYQDYSRASQLAQYGEHYVRNQEAFQEFIRQKQQAAAQQQQQQQQAKQWWRPPEYKQEWLEQVEVAPGGQLVAKAGYDPTIPGKIQAYRNFQRSIIDRLSNDFPGTIGEVIQQSIMPAIRQEIQQGLAGYNDNVYAQQFLGQNHQWLFQRDQSGQVAVDPTGKKVLSPYGQRFGELVSVLDQGGLKDVRAQERIARMALLGEIYTQQMQTQQQQQQVGQQQQQQQSQNDILKQQFLSGGAAHLPNFSGSTAPVQNPLLPNTQNRGLPLGQQILENLKRGNLINGDALVM